jgi:hypothetical protein
MEERLDAVQGTGAEVEVAHEDDVLVAVVDH